MRRNKKVIVIDADRLVAEFSDTPIPSQDYTICVRNGQLTDGRNFQIQVKVTVNEDDFIDDKP